MTIGQKICREMYAKGTWNLGVCETFCSKSKRFRCNFLSARIREAANEQGGKLAEGIFGK